MKQGELGQACLGLCTHLDWQPQVAESSASTHSCVSQPLPLSQSASVLQSHGMHVPDSESHSWKVSSREPIPGGAHIVGGLSAFGVQSASSQPVHSPVPMSKLVQHIVVEGWPPEAGPPSLVAPGFGLEPPHEASASITAIHAKRDLSWTMTLLRAVGGALAPR